jgi:dipeptidyl-peptidase-4
MRVLLLALLCAPLLSLAQSRQITLEDLYKKGTFRGEFVNARFDTSTKEPAWQWSRYKDQTGKSIVRPDDVVACPSKPGFTEDPQSQLCIFCKWSITIRNS